MTGCDDSGESSESGNEVQEPAEAAEAAEGKGAPAQAGPQAPPLSASGKFLEAIALASQEKFKEAIDAFNQVQVGWPDSP